MSKNFEVNIIFLIKRPCLYDQKLVEYLENEKSFLKMKQKTFFITFKGLSLKQIKQERDR